MEAHTWNSSTLKAEARGWRVCGQPGLQGETLSQNKNYQGHQNQGRLRNCTAKRSLRKHDDYMWCTNLDPDPEKRHKVKTKDICIKCELSSSIMYQY
jgi:hypothetical protein